MEMRASRASERRRHGEDSLARVCERAPLVRDIAGRVGVAGVSHSPTFRELAARLERSDVIVYVSVEPRRPGRRAGATRFVGATPRIRFLHIALDPDLSPKELVALLAHELQHAIEVADAPEVRDLDSFRQYYERHGFRDQRVDTYDSRAARETGRRVRAELASAPPEAAWIG